MQVFPDNKSILTPKYYPTVYFVIVLRTSFHTASSAASRISLCQWIWDQNQDCCTLALTSRCSYHSVRSRPLSARSHLHSARSYLHRLGLIYIRLYLIIKIFKRNIGNRYNTRAQAAPKGHKF